MELPSLEILEALGQTALAELPPQEFGEKTLARLLPLLGLDFGAIYLLQGQEFCLLAHHGFSRSSSLEHDPSARYLEQALSTRQILVVEGAPDPSFPGEGVKLYVPLVVGERALGVLMAGARRLWRPSSADLGHLKGFARAVSLALAFSLKHAEKEEMLRSFQQFVENEIVGVYVIQDGKIVFANAGLSRISGYAREEFLGRSYLDFVYPADRLAVQGNLERRLKGEEALRHYRFRALRKDGTIVTLEVQAWPIIYRGRPAVQGILRDVSWEAEAERLRRSLLAAAQEILASQSLEGVLRRTAQAVVENSPFRRAVVSLYDLRHQPPLLGPVLALATAGLTPEEEEKLRRQGGLTPEQRLLAFQEEFRIGRSYYIPHDRVPWDKHVGVPGRSTTPGWHPDDFLFIPLHGRAGIIGHISLDEPVTPREPTLEMLEPLEVFADLAALAAERAFQMEELQRHKGWLQGAFKLAHELSRFESVQELLFGALEILRREVRYEFGVVLLKEGEELVVCAAHSDLPGPKYSVGMRLPLGKGVVGWVAENRRPLRLGYVLGDPRYIPVHPQIRAELAVPILSGAEVLGVLDVESTEPERFRPEDEEFLLSVADLLAMTILGLRAREGLRELSHRDPLTNLYNRRYLFEVLSREMKRAQRYGHPFALALLDLDNFRQVNNVFGHIRGDEVLREIAKLLLESLRACDYVFRYGGDEFLLLLPETDEAGAEEAVKRLRGKLRAWSHTLGLGFLLDFSAGIVAYDPQNGRPPEELLREADQRMYAVKKARLG
ncbi:MAG: diguanylate cyclase domain-containing protein [Candidatus Bipolaricaulaceae bacterium]